MYSSESWLFVLFIGWFMTVIPVAIKKKTTVKKAPYKKNLTWKLYMEMNNNGS